MVSYTIDFNAFNRHVACVCLQFVAEDDDPVLWLPTWIAGSYLIREFAQNITNVIYKIDNDNTDRHYDTDNALRANKITKNRWQLLAKKGQTVRVYYSVYCFDLSVRTAYIDSERIFGNFSSLLLLTNDIDKLPCCTIDLIVPNAFFNRANATNKPNKPNKPDEPDEPDEPTNTITLAIGLPYSVHNTTNGRRYRLGNLPNKTLNGFDFMDFPFEISRQEHFDFYVQLEQQQILHRFFVSGVYQYDQQRLQQDLTDICQAYANWLGWLPFADYTFMTYATKSDYGGLEHINSTALITPRDDLPNTQTDKPCANYRRFLGLCSHEYFHAWWVKSVRPDVMMTSDLQHEAYTSLLWVFEGFTSYIDDFMLYQAGVICQDSYLALLAEQITRLYNNQGRAYQTVAESSFDAWIKLYRPNENSPNSTTSYYNKGAIVALALDLLLIKHNARLFDVIKVFTDKAKTAANCRFAMTGDNLDAVLEQFLPHKSWQDFKRNYIHGVNELPLDDWLLQVGIKLADQPSVLPFGLELSEGDNGLTVKNIALSTDCALSINDIIIAIDGLKADKKALQHAANGNTPILVHAFRRDVLMSFRLTPTYSHRHQISLSKIAHSVWLDKIS